VKFAFRADFAFAAAGTVKSRYCHEIGGWPISEFLIIGWQHGSLSRIG
jgi:hypothetical protein